MANERLRGALAAAGLSPEHLARQIEVDPKTVERWIASDRVPHRRHRWAAARLLGRDEVYLWPSAGGTSKVSVPASVEFVDLYPHRGAVPQHLWTSLSTDAQDRIDILVFAGLFLFDSNPDFVGTMVKKAQAGLQCRFLFGDPASAVVAARGDEEGIGDGLAARVRTSLRYLGPALSSEGIEVRLHDTILYNSLYRFDDDLLVNMHVHGTPAAQNPVLHLRSVPGGRMFEHYLASFARIWEQATTYPVEPGMGS